MAAVVVFAFWASSSLWQRRADPSKFRDTLHSALTNPVEFAKSQVTGGVGVLLRADSATGFPIVQGIGVGSPAERAGLRVGDVIIQVNGLATKGQPMAQIVDAIRGFTGGAVTVTIQRNGTTNFTCIIRRSSWNNLRGISYNQTPGSNKKSENEK